LLDRAFKIRTIIPILFSKLRLTVTVSYETTFLLATEVVAFEVLFSLLPKQNSSENSMANSRLNSDFRVTASLTVTRKPTLLFPRSRGEVLERHVCTVPPSTYYFCRLWSTEMTNMPLAFRKLSGKRTRRVGSALRAHFRECSKVRHLKDQLSSLILCSHCKVPSVHNHFNKNEDIQSTSSEKGV
jgi:hypothetical protein